MSGPTLFIKGKLEAHEYSPEQSVLDTYTPIGYILEWFEDRIPTTLGGKPKIMPKSVADRILIIQSSTGSGKSTVMPQELFHTFQKRTDKIIGITEPRVLTTKEIPVDVVSYNTRESLDALGFPSRTAMVMGENIGYKTRYFRNAPKKGIVYMTAGILQQQLNVMTDEQLMDMYSIIIVDEAHNTDIPTISLIYAIKKFIYRNYSNVACPFLILTTATFDTIQYSDYMLNILPKPDRYFNIIKIQGTSNPIEELFLDYNSGNYVDTVKKTVLRIQVDHLADIADTSKVPRADITGAEKVIKGIRDALVLGGGDSLPVIDIIVFVSGKEIDEITSAIIRLDEKVQLLVNHPVKPIRLNRTDVQERNVNFIEAIEAPADSISMIIRKKKVKVSRKLVVATNVAETGLTMKSLKFVIELGWVQGNYFNPDYNCYIMIRKPVSKDMHTQRKGRVGRVAPGICYSMFAKDTFEYMQTTQYSELFLSDISMDWLQFMILELFTDNAINTHSVKRLIESGYIEKHAQMSIDITKIDVLTPPPPDMLFYVMERLFVSGLINSNSIPTYSGLIASKMRRMSSQNARILLSGYVYGAPIDDLILLVCVIEDGTGFSLKDDKGLMPGVVFIDPDNKLRTGSGFFSKLYFVIGDTHIYSMLTIRHIISNPDSIESVCRENEIPYPRILGILERRDEIMLNLAGIGLDPFANKRELTSFKSPVEYSSLIKECIYDGYKMEMLLWNKDKKRYFDRRTGLELHVTSPLIYSPAEIEAFSEVNPHCILYYGLNYTQDRKSIIYLPKIRFISIMDGYVDVDTNYDYAS